jgi:hypothetical protein
MRSELAKLAVASTAATVFIWLLSLMTPRCVFAPLFGAKADVERRSNQQFMSK